MYAWVRRLRALFTRTKKTLVQAPPKQSPSAVKRVQPPTLSRRAILSSLPIMAVPWSVVRALEAVLPFDDGWRFGWIFPQEAHQAKIYYGLDMSNPERSVIYVERGGLLTSITMEQLKENNFIEAASEILISQGHRGLKLTGGLKMLPGDEADFDEVSFKDDTETVMLGGTTARDEEQAVQQAAHGRDATEAEMSHAENPLYRLITGPTPSPVSEADRFYVDAMVDIETYDQGQAIIDESWPMTDDAIGRLKALVHEYALKHGA